MDDPPQTIETFLAGCRAPGRLMACFDLPLDDVDALFEFISPLAEAAAPGVLKVIYPPWWIPSDQWKDASRVELRGMTTGEQVQAIAHMQQCEPGDCVLVIDADHLSPPEPSTSRSTVQNGPAGETMVTAWPHFQCQRLAALITAWRETPTQGAASCILASKRRAPPEELFGRYAEDGACGVAHGADAELDIYSAVARWSAALRDGAAPANVVAEIREALPAEADVEEAAGQAFYLAGDWERAWAYLSEARAPNRAHLANIAHQLGLYEEACELIASIQPKELVDIEALGFTRLIALRLRLTQRAQALEDRLIELHPNCLPVLDIRVYRLAQSDRWSEVIELVDGPRTPAQAFYCALAEIASHPAQPIDTFIDRSRRLGGPFAEAAWGEAARVRLTQEPGLEVARHLIACRQRLPRWNAAVDLLEAIIQDPDWIDQEPVVDILCQLLDIILDEAARAPERTEIRTGLTSLFQPGRLGFEALALLVRLFASPRRPPRLKPPKQSRGEEVTREELTAYIKQRIENNPNRVMRLDRPGIIPPDQRPQKPAALLLAVIRLMGETADAGTEAFEHSHMGFASVIYTALELIETAGGTLVGVDKPAAVWVAGQAAAINGYGQLTLQLAETALTLGRHAAPRQRRHAWFAHADLSARAGHAVEALISYLCSQRVKVSKLGVDWRLAELELSIRLARMLGISQVVDALYREGRRIQAQYKLSGGDDSLSDAYWSCRLLAVTALDGASGHAEAKEVIDYYAHRLSSTYARGTNIKAILVMLGSAIEHATQMGALVDDNVRAEFDRVLKEMPRADRRAIDALLGEAPTLEDLRTVTAPVARTRYGADLPAHLSRARIVARRLLSKQQPAFLEALVAFELLADTAIARRSAHDDALGEIARLQSRWVTDTWTDGGVPPAFLHDVMEPTSTPTHAVFDLICAPDTEAPTLLAHLPSRSTLVAVGVAWDGAPVHAIHPARTVQRAETNRLKLTGLLRRVYTALDPRLSGDARAATNEVISALGPLGINVAEPDEVIILPSADLASLPFNTLPNQGALLGAEAPVTTVPSLCWLAEVADAPLKTGRAVWVLPGRTTSDGELDALTWMAEQLGPATRSYGFDVAFSAQPPRNLAQAGVAIVVAHGGLDMGNQLTRVADEEGNALSAQGFAARVRGADVVVALVCSGGRQTPTAERPTGLPRLLLADETRAVVACPWVLDARVAMRWLPFFLDEWARNRPLSHAVFHANRRLRADHSHPGDWAAMHVFGCPDVMMPVE